MTKAILHATIFALSLRLTTACGGYYVGSGNITSPNYPNQYPKISRCTWTLTATAEHDIMLRVIYLDTEQWKDFIYVYKGIIEANTLQSNYLIRYSGRHNEGSDYNASNRTLVVGPTATVTFSSDSIVEASGFLIEFTSISISRYTDCGGDLFGSGNITSPIYPRWYPLNSRCLWTLTANPGTVVALRIIDFNTEHLYDYVTLFNGTNSSSSDYTYRFSGQLSHDISSYYSLKPMLLETSATVLFTSDSSISASGFQIEYTSINLTPYTGCGGSLVGEGNITSPNYPSFYPLNSRCTWTLTANPGTYISLRIISMDTESSHDYVYVFNGTVTPHLLLSDYWNPFSGRIYSSLKPFITGPSASIVFISDTSVSASGFQIEFTNVDLTPYTDCGDSLFGSGNISSPHYPNQYPMNSRCIWTLVATTGSLISIRIIHLNTEIFYDYLNIFNGTKTSNSSLSGDSIKYTGKNYYSSKAMLLGSTATIVFISDSSISASGFQIEYKSLDVSPYTDCGGSLFGEGNITSPNYPNLYPMNSHCTWKLTANPGSYISLKMISIDTESLYDYVYVFNGTRSSNSSLIDYSNRYSGRDYYGSYYYSSRPMLLGPTATIVFISDSSVSASGFQIEYTSIDMSPYTGCGGSLVRSGNITTPNYPNMYPLNSRCTWTITTNPHSYISLRIIRMDTEASYDYVYIFNESRTSNSSLSGYFNRYSGRQYYGSYYYSSKPVLIGPTVTIVFISDSSVSASGFQIEYTSFDMSLYTGCGGNLFGAGNITSPNYPIMYPLNSRCTWTITANAGAYILLRIISIDTESSYDYVYVFNGTRASNSSLSDYLFRYSGRYYYGVNYYISKPMLMGPAATILFISDFSLSATGFQIEYTSIDVSPYTGCGGSLAGEGNITSPNYPNLYPLNCRCIWSLTANPDTYISLRIISMDTENSYDYVYVFNESRTANSSLSGYSNLHSGHDKYGSYYYSSKPTLLGPTATIVFISDSSVSASGFQLEFTSIDISLYTGCGGSLLGAGNITSPNYPGFYPLNSRCTWTLTANPSSFISLRIINMDIENAYDYVYVFNGTIASNSSLSDSFNQYSGRDYYGSYYYSSKPTLIGSTATILFISDSSVSASGFQMEFKSISVSPYTACGGSLLGAGNITSPNFPNHYPSNSRCTWTLTADPGSNISLKIISMDTESSYDYVYVFNGTTAPTLLSSDYTSRYSGRDYLGSYYYSSKPMLLGRSVTIVFVSDASVSASGFQIEYLSFDATTFTDCGTRLFGSGNITSPNYPNQYPMNSRCIWTLAANPGSFVSIRMIHLDIESSYDYLYILNGTETSDSSLSDYLTGYLGLYSYGSYYYSSKPVVTGPSATVVFVSDSSVSASGFQMEYTSIDMSPFTGCGGSLFGFGNITTPNYPSLYPLNSRCTWTLTANPDSYISLRIISMNTESSYDYVYVFNGTRMPNSSLSDYSIRYCGQYYHGSNYYSSKPVVTGPSATIVFISDSSVSASGFQIEFASVYETPFAGNTTATSFVTSIPTVAASITSVAAFTTNNTSAVDTTASVATIAVAAITEASNVSDVTTAASTTNAKNTATISPTVATTTAVPVSPASVTASVGHSTMASAFTPSEASTNTTSGPGSIASNTTSAPAAVPVETTRSTTFTNANASSTPAAENIGHTISNASASAAINMTSATVTPGNITLATILRASATESSTAAATSIYEGEATTVEDKAAIAASAATATVTTGESDYSVGSSTTAGNIATNEPPVKTTRRCRLRRNNTTSALPNH